MIKEKELSPELLKEISDKLISECKLIESGFLILQKLMIPENADQAQINDMRIAFFAGAQHLMSTIMTVFDPESEPTEADMKRLESIMLELDGFGTEIKKIIQEYNEKEKNPSGLNQTH